ncbi:MAG: sigma-54-dependent Fis family transcriptional regulator [Kiritimatiellae bacterium]|nr:sigma-54-dependent Fis family transcriptional regulator [Kiritimatiellia bacterium]
MPNNIKVLVIDDEESMREGCRQTLADEGYRVQTAVNGNQGLEMARREAFDLIILDLRMPGIDGMAVLAELKEYDPDAVVVVITGFANIETAVEAMRRGAYDFLPKPFTPETLAAIALRAADRRKLAIENVCLRRELDDLTQSVGIVGQASAMKNVAEVVRKVAPSDSTVLICGETGVGKELIARAMHTHSHRRDKPFVVVDCGALVETLFESELFGHVKGAFTGATETKHGKFELANGGTIFLDEVANVGPNIQGKLLRVIQERQIVKVGSSQIVEVDVRIIAATNKDLQEEMKQGRFKEDLFYRLSVIPIHIPPLRQRREDIPLLAEHFLKKYCARRKKEIGGISAEALRALEGHDWPGNVRELENAIERAVVMADGDVIEPCDLLYYGLALAAPSDPAPGGRLAEVERLEIIRALKQFEGHKSKAAEYLGINRKTLREKIRRYAIDDADPANSEKGNRE